MFLFVFKALFTDFCYGAYAKYLAMLKRIRHTCVALKHKKTVLSLETSSEIKFRIYQICKKIVKCLPMTKNK